MLICCRECENQVHRLVLRQNVVPRFQQTQKGAKWLVRCWTERQGVNASGWDFLLILYWYQDCRVENSELNIEVCILSNIIVFSTGCERPENVSGSNNYSNKEHIGGRRFPGAFNWQTRNNSSHWNNNKKCHWNRTSPNRTSPNRTNNFNFNFNPNWANFKHTNVNNFCAHNICCCRHVAFLFYILNVPKSVKIFNLWCSAQLRRRKSKQEARRQKLQRLKQR